MTFFRNEQGVHVIRGDHEFVERVAVAVKVPDGIRHDAIRRRVLENHGSITRVEPLLEPLGKVFEIIRLLLG